MTSRETTAVDATAFARDGFLAPVAILTSAQCRLVEQRAREIKAVGAGKDLATRDRFFFDVATGPRPMAVVEALLGKDIVLWGVEFIERPPGAVHHWHVDIETAAPDRNFLSLWIGLGNTNRDSALAVLSGSHRFGKTIQEVQFLKGVERGAASDETIGAWGRAFDPAAAVVQPDVANGEAIVFDGHIWHGSRNRRMEGTRTALLLQYAAADAPLRRADLHRLSWPIGVIENRPIPSILVAGKAGSGNWLVDPPSAATTAIGTEARALDALAGAGKTMADWRTHPLFSGKTANLDRLTCHASVLMPGKSPHEPHRHLEEELLIVVDGEAELVLPADASLDDAPRVRATAGTIAYYPAYQRHTLRNPGATPVTYLMFKWQGRLADGGVPLETSIWSTDAAKPDSARSFRTLLIAERPTAFLDKLHVHVSEVDPGGGYDAHRDDHDVALLVLAGAVESGGQSVGRGGLVFHAAGELHGLRNAGSETARYVVFEFHGPGGQRAFPPAPFNWQGLKGSARQHAGRAYRLLRRVAGLG